MRAKQKANSEVDETIAIDDSGEPLKPKWWQLHLHWHHFSRKTKIISAAFLLLLIAALVVFGILLQKNVIAPGHSQSAASKSNLVPSPLTGVLVKPALAKRPVTGVMIENSLDARPQSGLNDAGVVFEAVAEGGITRFIALFQEGQPQYVGPVRSLRPYYIDWASGFDASIAHVGGSPAALQRIRKGGKDLDEFFNSSAYWRVNSRPSPHNVYTSFKNLDKLNTSKGYKTSDFRGWARKAEQPPKAAKVSTIDLAISGPEFNVSYSYNPGNNTYKRKEGGRFHTSTSSASLSTAQIIHPKVVIAMVVGYAIDADGHHSDYETVGSGTAFIFQDGGSIKATWQKTAHGGPLQFLDEKGKPIALDAGQTWVTALDSKADIHVK